MGRPGKGEPGAGSGRELMSGELRSRLSLIVVTDAAAARPRSILEVVQAALSAGAPCIQLREKEASTRAAFELGRELQECTRSFGALFMVNDRFDLALALGADGVHLGPDDLPLAEVRRAAPEGFILGYSTDQPDEALRAQAAGADYLGCGAVWPTSSKLDTGEAIGPDGVAAVAGAVSIPVVAIGGVSIERVALLRGRGAAGVAVLGAVMGAPDPAAATASFLSSLGR